MLRPVGGKQYGVLTSIFGMAELICISCDYLYKICTRLGLRHRDRGEGVMGSALPWKYAHWLAEAETFSLVV